MNTAQLSHYRNLPSLSQRANYLVQIGEATNYQQAMSQMSSRGAGIRRARSARANTTAPVQMSRVSMAYLD